MQDITAAAPAAEAPVAAAGTPLRTLAIRFTGSGSEYFRIWAVNLLLILVTLGLYLPFAKARRIRYFYANTLIDGQALSFHGDAWKMFRGFILLALLMGVYSATGHFAPAAALPAFVVLCAVWPALWRASLQFRLGNTAWRGLRMRFEGSLKDAYLACLPIYLPSIALVAAGRLLSPQPTGDRELDQAAAASFGMWMLAAVAVAAVFTPWSIALFKRYQHNGYRIASQHARVNLGTGEVYALSVQTMLIYLGSLFVVAIVIALGIGALAALGLMADVQQHGIKSVGGGLLMVFALVAYLLQFAIVMPFAAARMQNLVWKRTASESLIFVSELRFVALFKLTLKNWLLTALTLGLYRPFAAISTARLRLQAVQIEAAEDPEAWVAPAGSGHADATGDVAGDFFGIDMGL